jgi:hypothetical protein
MKQEVFIMHMLDLLDFSRIARKEGLTLRRIRKGFWMSGNTELHVSQFVGQGKIFRITVPGYARPHYRLRDFEISDTRWCLRFGF